MSKPRPFYLGGEFISSDETLAVHDPYDGSEVGVACLAGSKAVEAAIKTAGRAFRKYRRQPAYERAALLARIRDGVAGRREVLASLLAREAGQPIGMEIPATQFDDVT